jgi:transposase
MTDLDRSTDRRGQRAKRILTPLQKYEVWLQLIRQEVTVAGAAIAWQVDPSTITRIKAVAKDGALAALSESKPGARGARAGLGVGGAAGRQCPAGRSGQADGGEADADRGKEGWG